VVRDYNSNGQLGEIGLFITPAFILYRAAVMEIQRIGEYGKFGLSADSTKLIALYLDSVILGCPETSEPLL
jgi:hypothetical protein